MYAMGHLRVNFSFYFRASLRAKSYTGFERETEGNSEMVPDCHLLILGLLLKVLHCSA